MHELKQWASSYEVECVAATGLFSALMMFSSFKYNNVDSLYLFQQNSLIRWKNSKCTLWLVIKFSLILPILTTRMVFCVWEILKFTLKKQPSSHKLFPFKLENSLAFRSKLQLYRSMAVSNSLKSMEWKCACGKQIPKEERIFNLGGKKLSIYILQWCIYVLTLCCYPRASWLWYMANL